jgi:hypothetical protein
MSSVSDTVADVSHAVELLGLIAEREKDPAAARVGWVLKRWLAGEAFEAAAGLPTDWRWRLQIEKRDQALAELARLRADLDPANLARWIRAELPRAARSSAVRRDGALGYVDDLARSGCGGLGDRNLRELLGDIRGRGKREACDCHGKLGGSAK